MTAVRLARAATGRERGDQVRRLLPRPRRRPARRGGLRARDAGDPRLARASRRRRRPTRSSCRGTTRPRSTRRSTTPASVAAILAEPLPANMGLVPPREGFLELLRERCDAAGALLVLDEVITGFRVARGGAQELLGVEPDLTMLGKVLGGGLPLAAVAGRARRDGAARAGRARPTRPARCPATRSRPPPGSRRCAARRRAPTSGSRDDRPARSGALGCRGAGARCRWSRETGLLTVFFSRAAGDRLRRRAGTATTRRSPLLGPRCSSGASTCRRPRSRRGSPRWPTPTSTRAHDRGGRARRSRSRVWRERDDAQRAHHGAPARARVRGGRGHRARRCA